MYDMFALNMIDGLNVFKSEGLQRWLSQMETRNESNRFGKRTITCVRFWPSAPTLQFADKNPIDILLMDLKARINCVCHPIHDKGLPTMLCFLEGLGAGE